RRAVELDLGEVEFAPRARVLAPPGHAVGVLEHQVVVLAVLVDDEEVVDRDRAAVGEHQLQVVTDALEARHLFRSQLEPDDAGLVEDAVAGSDGHGLAGNLLHDLCGHGFPLGGWSGRAEAWQPSPGGGGTTPRIAGGLLWVVSRSHPWRHSSAHRAMAAPPGGAYLLRSSQFCASFVLRQGATSRGSRQ